MATAKKTAAPAKKAAKAAAPAVAVGTWITFLGYAEGVPEAEQVLEANTSYQVTELKQGGVEVVIANPDFNPRKKVDDANAENIAVDVIDGEFEISAEQDDAEATAPAAEPEPVAPAVKTAKGKAPAKEAAKPAAKTKAVKEPKAPVVKEDPDSVPDLDGESEDILAMVTEAGDDLLGTVQELETQSNRTEFHIGGLLYHMKKTGAYKTVDKKAYAGPGGFRDYCENYLQMGGRKADNLIDIYVKFTQHAEKLGGDPAELVGAMGWGKASRIASYFDQPGVKHAKLIEAGTNMTLQGLNTFIQDKVRIGKDAREVVKRTTVSFKYLEEEGELIQNILIATAEALSLKDAGAALAHIVKEYGAKDLATKPAGKTAAPVKSTAASKTAKPVAKKVAATA